MGGVMMPYLSTLAQAGVVTISDPTVLTSLQVWYNADTDGSPNFNTTNGNGGSSSQWQDRSGTGHNANQSGNASVKPKWYSSVLNNLGVLRFDGVDEKLTINPIAWMQNLAGFSLYVVAKFSNLTGTRVITGTDQSGFKIYHNGTNLAVSTSGGVGTSVLSADTSAFHRFGLIFDGTGTGNADRLKFRYNGQGVALTYTGTVGTTTSGSATSFNIGVDQTGSAGWFAGDIAEVLMFTRTLTNGEILSVEKYLKDHWAL